MNSNIIQYYKIVAEAPCGFHGEFGGVYLGVLKIFLKIFKFLFYFILN
jgi:hypothetical protein